MRLNVRGDDCHFGSRTEIYDEESGRIFAQTQTEEDARLIVASVNKYLNTDT